MYLVFCGLSNERADSIESINQTAIGCVSRRFVLVAYPHPGQEQLPVPGSQAKVVLCDPAASESVNIITTTIMTTRRVARIQFLHSGRI